MIAVVIPCHSHFKFLSAAIRALDEQTRLADIVIPVIDLPKDDEQYGNYMKLVCGWGVSTDNHVHPVKTKGNQGVSLARNLGFQTALDLGYDWVVPFDEDDLLRDNFIESLKEAVEWCPEVDVFYTDWSEFGDRLGFHRTPEYSFNELAQHPFIPVTSGIRVATWEKVRAKTGTGFDENLMRNGLRWEDYLFFLEAGLLGTRMARFGAGALLQVRRHGESGTDVANATIPEWRKYAGGKLKEHYDFEVAWQ